MGLPPSATTITHPVAPASPYKAIEGIA